MMPVCFLRPGHPATDGLEDFGLSQFRYQETKGIATGDFRPDITARTGAAINDSSKLKLAERPVHSHSGGTEFLDEICFARKALPGLILTRGDGFFEGLENFLMFGCLLFLRHGLI